MANPNLYSKSKFVKELKPSDFESKNTWKLKTKDCCVVAFYAHWCPHCVNMTSTWEELGEKAAFFKVYAFNCANMDNEKHVSKIKQDKPGLINGYPSIILYRDGVPVEKYEGGRDIGSLINLCIRSCKK